MVIHSYGHNPSETHDAENLCRSKNLLLDNFELILNSHQKILNRGEYFFSQPACASCSWPYVGGDGPLPLGYLLIGWSKGTFTEPCTKCAGYVYLTWFSGSILSGSTCWSGICRSCRTIHSGKASRHKTFIDRVQFVTDLRRKYPAEITEWIEHDGLIFSWGGNGLQSARKKQPISTPTANPIPFELVVSELASAVERPDNPPNVEWLKISRRIKFGKGIQKYDIHFPF